jgi:hypothetical protein
MSSARGPGPPPGRLGEVAVPVCDWAEGEGEGGGETADDGVDACDTPAQVDGCRPGQRPEGDGRPGQDLGDAYHPPVELGRDDRLARNNAWLKNRISALNLRNLINRGLDHQNGAWALA